MKNLLSILGAFGLTASGATMTMNVVACGDNNKGATIEFILPEQPKTLEETLEKYNFHKNEMNRLMKTVNKDKPSSTKEQAKFLLNSEEYQYAVAHQEMANAYVAKEAQFKGLEKEFNNTIKSMELHIKIFKKSEGVAIASKTVEVLDEILVWAKTELPENNK